jgi:probable HAF family extracellular repeat protein
MMKRLLNVAAVLGVVLAGSAGRGEATEYIYTTIDYPGADYTYAMGINDLGKIVGWYNVGGRSHAFSWTGGVFASFDHPTAASGGSGAYGINNSGQIVGWYDTVGADNLGAYLRDGNEYRQVAPLLGSAWTEACGINESANVAGWYRDAGGVDRGFLFDGTSYTTFTDPDAVTTWAFGINNAGVIVGMGWESTGLPHGFVRDASGNLTNFYVEGLPAGGGGINDLGQIVGSYSLPGGRWGYVLTGGVNATPDKIVPPGATDTLTYDINNLGQVVGYYLNASGMWGGFLATPIAAADFNKDGDVDGADLALWQGDYGLNADCDADGDGDTDGADFLVWQRQLNSGATAVADAASVGYGGVPEPTALALGGTWFVMAVLGRARRAACSRQPGASDCVAELSRLRA